MANELKSPASRLRRDLGTLESYATVIGILAMVSGLTQIAASFIGGLLWDKVNSQATFYLGAALAALAVVLLFTLLPSGIQSNQHQ